MKMMNVMIFGEKNSLSTEHIYTISVTTIRQENGMLPLLHNLVWTDYR